jgi:hypothetical protein
MEKLKLYIAGYEKKAIFQSAPHFMSFLPRYVKNKIRAFL